MGGDNQHPLEYLYGESWQDMKARKLAEEVKPYHLADVLQELFEGIVVETTDGERSLD